MFKYAKSKKNKLLNDRHKKLMAFEVFKDIYAGLSLLSFANSRMKLGLVGCFELHRGSSIL